MGTINHNCVIATTWNTDRISEVERWISSLDEEGKRMFTISDKVINGYMTVFCGPDGSKEGWDNSDDGDRIRNDFIELIESHKYDDGSSPWDWVEIGWGEYGQNVLRGNNENCYNNKEYATDK